MLFVRIFQLKVFYEIYMDETVEEDVQVEEKEEIVSQEPVKEPQDAVSKEQSSQVEIDKLKEVVDKVASLDKSTPLDKPKEDTNKEEDAPIEVEKKSDFMINKEVEVPMPSSPKNVEAKLDNAGLSFSGVDRTIDENNNEELVTAPKTDAVLEKISEIRHEQRKLEEEEEDTEESLTIGDSINLDEMTVQNLNTQHKINPDPVLTDIEILS